ncbi:MAG: type II secretion system F family protein [Planctomycetota bacterium]|jgi:type II secretory pathway component PulF
MTSRLRWSWYVLLVVPALLMALILGVAGFGTLKPSVRRELSGQFLQLAALESILLTLYFGMVKHYAAEFRSGLFQVLSRAARRGLSMGKAFLAIADDYEGPERRALYRVLRRLDQGFPLSVALEEGARGFVPGRFVAPLRAAERDGGLVEALEGLERDALHDRSFRGRAMFLMLYPLFLFFLLSSVSSLTMPILRWTLSDRPWVTMPRGEQFVETMTAHVDTGVLAGDIASYLLWGTLIGMAVLILSGRNWIMSRVRVVTDPVLIRLPFVGRYVQAVAAERFCHALGPLVRTGRPLHTALSRSGEATGNVSVRRAADRAATQLEEGKPAGVVIAALPLPRFVRARLSAALSSSSGDMMQSITWIADQCGRRKVDLGKRLIALIYPTTLIVASCLMYMLFRSLMFIQSGIPVQMTGVEEIIPW